MTTKRTLLISIVVILLLTIGIGATYAQGSRNGQRGNGAGRQGQQLQLHVPGTNLTDPTLGTQQQLGQQGYGQQAGAGQGQQLQLHVPGTNLTDPTLGTQQQLGQQNSTQLGYNQQYNMQQGYGQGNMSRNQGQNMSGMGLGTVYSTMVPFTGELSDNVVAALEAGWADEQNAYAVYQAVIDQFGAVAPFTSIQRAEASHAAALESAFTYYGIELPTAPANETLVSETLTFTSLEEACAVAAEAEIANMGLYDEWMATVSDYPDLVQIFTNLRNASEFSHLPAFQSCAG